MRNLRRGCVRRQLQFLQRQYLQDGEMPLSNMLSESLISGALKAIEGSWNERIYTPLVTLWVFLGQAISADHSCRAAVARLIAHRVAHGLSACSARTGAYCQARMRLPEEFFATIARALGRQLEDQAEEKWLWKGRHVYSNWRNLFTMKQRGVDVVTRLNKALRKADFSKGKLLGKDDHVVPWPKPWIRGIDRETQKSMPMYLMVRECKIDIKQPGFRTKEIIIVTTLLDPIEYTKEDLAVLYLQRWNNETDLRSIKTEMKMECLRCKSPELVRNEIWTYAIAYNLIRTTMAQAANEPNLLPRTISFKGAMQTLTAFQPIISTVGSRNKSTRELLYEQLLQAITLHRVADRPNRFEPRRIKRRHKHYVPLAVPRDEAKRQILKGLTKN